MVFLQIRSADLVHLMRIAYDCDIDRSWGCVWIYLGLDYLSYVYLIMVIIQLRHFMFIWVLDDSICNRLTCGCASI